jgi:hypothetical protein
MTKTTTEVSTIELNVREIAQLFETLDPYPFLQRDLDKDAEEFIVGWAREMGHRDPLTIVVHLPPGEEKSEAARDLQRAVPRFFAYRADVLGRDFNELFRIGRMSLLVGVTVLAVCIGASQLIAGWVSDLYLGRFIGESIIIVGWVANWRPIEIFLYDWWPLLRRRNLYRRLAAADVVVRSDGKTG